MIIGIDAIDIKSLGGLIHLQQLTNKLTQKNTYIKVISNSYVKKNFNKNRNNKIQIIENNVFDRNYIFRHIWKSFFFKKNLKKNNCKILVSLNGIYHGFFKPTVLIQQNILPFDKFAQKKYSLGLKIKFFLQKVAILISIIIHKNIIFTSNDIKNRIEGYFKYKNNFISKVIYHGVSKGIKIKKNFLIKNKIKILFVSEFEKYKNHEILLDAIKQDKEKLVELTCVGRFKEIDMIKLKTKYNLKNLKVKIIKKTSQKKILNMYKNYDALIFPTLCESFGLPLLEASANKLPILCSNLQIFKEVYSNGCFYFNPKYSESILKTIYLFYNSKNKKISKKVNHNFQIANRLNWDKFGRSYYHFIFKIVNFYEKKN